MPEPPLSGEQRHPDSHRPSHVERFSQVGGGSKASLPVVDWSAAHKTALHLRAGEPLDSPRTPLRDESLAQNDETDETCRRPPPLNYTTRFARPSSYILNQNLE